jgi:hypothetical protein
MCMGSCPGGSHYLLSRFVKWFTEIGLRLAYK